MEILKECYARYTREDTKIDVAELPKALKERGSMWLHLYKKREVSHEWHQPLENFTRHS